MSYWRRLAHARIDVLEAQSGHAGTLSLTDLVRVLGDTASGHSRRALVSVKPATRCPSCPQLDEMWGTHVDPDDDAQTTAAVEGLRTAEQQLTDYRHALHERIDEATRELILRYRADPRAALTLIPRNDHAGTVSRRDRPGAARRRATSLPPSSTRRPAVAGAAAAERAAGAARHRRRRSGPP